MQSDHTNNNTNLQVLEQLEKNIEEIETMLGTILLKQPPNAHNNSVIFDNLINLNALKHKVQLLKQEQLLQTATVPTLKRKF